MIDLSCASNITNNTVSLEMATVAELSTQKTYNNKYIILNKQLVLYFVTLRETAHHFVYLCYNMIFTLSDDDVTSSFLLCFVFLQLCDTGRDQLVYLNLWPTAYCSCMYISLFLNISIIFYELILDACLFFPTIALFKPLKTPCR